MVMIGSTDRCIRTVFVSCRRAISSIPCALAARSPPSFFCSDEDQSHGRTSECCLPPDNHLLSASLKSLAASSSRSFSDEKNSHVLIGDLKSLDYTHSHGWNQSAQPVTAQKNPVSAQKNVSYYWPPLSSSPSFSFSDEEDNRSQSRVLRPHADKTISVFWDLDNKPPHSVPPYEAAVRLREVACSFGRLVDMVAYANRHAFSYLPSWVKEERRHRKELDRLEVSGLVVPAESYVCGYCGCKCRTNMALKKHFKQLHERERNKRLHRLDSLKGKKKIKYKQSLIDKETRYREASRDLLAPRKVGYGLMQELKRAGVWVKMVSDRPQAADEALMRHISRSIHMGIKCICLVSDDSDFLTVLHEARAQHLHTVVVGDRPRLKAFADVQFSWADLASGRAFDKAVELATMWYSKDKLDEDSSQLGSGIRRKMDVREAEHFHLRTRDFQEWDVSDSSDQENGDILEAESECDGSSGLWLSEDGDSDAVDAEDDEVAEADDDHDVGNDKDSL